MELLRTFREKKLIRRQALFKKQAEEVIQLSDFDDGLYIAYNGTPLVAIEPSWTSAEIIDELKGLRQNFVNSRLKENGMQRFAAVL